MIAGEERKRILMEIKENRGGKKNQEKDRRERKKKAKIEQEQ